MEILTNTNNYVVKRQNVFIDQNHIRHITYVINKDGKALSEFKVNLPEIHRPEISTTIVNEKVNFVNGFKVVQTSNGEYGYIRESDNALLPYRYDIAFDFNQYGFAIVGKDGNVTWINKDFQHLNLAGRMVDENKPNASWSKTDGWLSVDSFSNGNIPLSLIYDNKTIHNSVTAYFGIDGKLKEFYHYNGKLNDDYPKTHFNNGTPFDKSGNAIADNYLLFAKGYYTTYKYLIEFCKEKGFITLIDEEADKYFGNNDKKLTKYPINKK